MICPRVPSQQAAELGFETRQSEPRACGLRVCNGCGLSPPPACFHPYSYAFLFYVLDFWVPFFENAVIDITGKKYTVPTRPLNQKEHHLEKRGHSGHSLLTWVTATGLFLTDPATCCHHHCPKRQLWIYHSVPFTSSKVLPAP